MILFQQDWARYPTAMVHYETKNSSWLRQARVYHDMGVKNWAFLLALIQPELKNVDPHDPNLSTELKVKIGMECRWNPWYFFREVVRVPAQGGPIPNPLEANRGNIALYWSFFNDIDTGLIQPRQTGKSVSTDCLMINLNYISSVNSRINMITKDDGLRKANVDRLKNIRNLLPPYLVPMLSSDSDNVFELTCNKLGNKYVTGVAQNNESSANNLGRGLTSPVQHIDEGPFISFIGTTIPAALAAGTAAKAEAKKYGLPCANIFTTTAGKMDDRDGAFMYELFSEAAVWTEAFLDAKDKADLLDMVNRNKKGRKVMINITMSHRQLGKTDEWLYEAINNAKSAGEAADRDFFNRWTSGSRKSPLSVQLNELIRNSQMDPKWVQMSKENYAIRWFHPEHEIREIMREVPVVIGMDTSDAVGRDAITMVFTNPYDLSVLGVGTYNETMIPRFSEYVADLLIQYPKAILCVERRSSGQSIIDHVILQLIRHGVDPFRRMYNRIVDDNDMSTEAYRELLKPMQYRTETFYDKRKSFFGVPTDNRIRTLLYVIILQTAAKSAGMHVRDLSLINEITSLVEKNGRIDHTSSGHDDHVISWLLTHWFLQHTRNLSHYGIDPAIVAAGTNVGQEDMSPTEIMARSYQERLLKEMEGIMDELASEKDNYIQAKLEAKLRAISSRLETMDVKLPSLDALLSKAREERDKRLRNPLETTNYRGLERELDMGRLMAA